jgi:phospholipid-binding lipoprotein MlaA
MLDRSSAARETVGPMARWNILFALTTSMLAAGLMAPAPAGAKDIGVPLTPDTVHAGPAVDPSEIHDPLEGFNRRMFAIDRGFRKLVGDKAVTGSAHILPLPLRHDLYNFFNNLDEPSNFANDVLQGKVGKAAVAAGRFATNTTVGLLGTRDVATGWGMKRHREDLGQTLAVYGVKPGPYIYLPLTGPSTVRDKAGDEVDGMVNPLHYASMGLVAGEAVSATHTIVQPHTLTIRQRAREAARSGMTDDEYATLRRLYYEQRAAEVRDLPGSDSLTAPGARPHVTATVDYSRNDAVPSSPLRPAPMARPVSQSSLPAAQSPRAGAAGENGYGYGYRAPAYGQSAYAQQGYARQGYPQQGYGRQPAQGGYRQGPYRSYGYQSPAYPADAATARAWAAYDAGQGPPPPPPPPPRWSGCAYGAPC